MSKKIRYLLIFIGFVIFVILAPLIILYVRGISFDFRTRQFLKTGIIAVRTEPKSVEIFVDGELKRKSSGDLKFLLPGEYLVEIKKDGYFSWSKMIAVLPGQVTWANPVPNKLHLFLSQPGQTELANEVKDYAVSGNDLAFLSGDDLALIQRNNLDKQEIFLLPKPASHIAASPDGKIFLLTNFSAATTAALTFNRESKGFTDISALLAPGIKELKFDPDGRLYALEDGTLSLVNIGQKTKTALKTGVLAFTFRGNDLYYIRQSGPVLSLLMADSPQNEGTAILNGLPEFTDGKIFISFERQILLLLDKGLYKVGGRLEKLTDGAMNESFDYGESTLVFFHSGELGFYNPFSKNINFITRSSAPITAPKLTLAFASGFFIRDNKLEVIELDSRDRQNNYILYEGRNLQKYDLDEQTNYAYILDDGKLKVIKIR